MSLIITSSSQGLDETNQIGIARPEQYKNHMRNSLMIEKDSEIAVESVKINRLPMLDAGAGIVGNYWFGPRLTVASPLEKSIQYIIPTKNTIGRSLEPVDFADAYLNTLKEAYSLHPEINSTTIEMNTKYSAGGVFEGYEYKIPQVGAAPANLLTKDALVADPFNTNDDGTDAMTWDGTTITSQYDDQFGQIQPRAGEGGPIALNAGLFQISGLDKLDKWTCGLSRPYCFNADTEQFSGVEEVFHADMEGGLGPQSDQFYDYAAEVGDDGFLRLYHSAPTHDILATVNDLAAAPYEQRASPNGETMVMSEIIYYNNTNTAFNSSNYGNTDAGFLTNTAIDWSAKGGVIAFSVSGEKMTITLDGKVVCSPVTVNASTKGQIPKPIGQTAWKMYPTFGLWEDGDSCDIDKYMGRTESTMWNNQPENTWITKCTQPTYLPDNGSSSATEEWNPYAPSPAILPTAPAFNNARGWGHSLDCRDMFRPLALTASGPVGTTVHTYKDIVSSMISTYENIFITGRSERYMDRSIQQWQPNSGLILGFYPMGFSPLSTMGALGGGIFGASFVSAQRPSLMSQHTSFIRVPTFTHETFNFGTGNPSKILFQIPRFDNAGTETGALYYQNNDKTYVDLNNATELYITELDVHIVRKNETFVEDLTGSTEIVFHVRKKK